MITVTPYVDNRSALRYQAQMSAQGYYAENFPRGDQPSKDVVASGSVYFSAIGLLAGDVITNILTIVGTAGTGFSGIGLKLGVYSKAGLLLASTGDVSAAHGSQGSKVNALSAPYTVLTTDGYFIAMIQVGSANLAVMRGSGSGNNNFTAFGSTQLPFGLQTGQTDLPTPSATIAASNNAFSFWFGVS